jgi:hypothetical protein
VEPRHRIIETAIIEENGTGDTHPKKPRSETFNRSETTTHILWINKIGVVSGIYPAKLTNQVIRLF